MNLRTALRNILRKLVGWGLVVLSGLFFAATFILFTRGDYGPFATGLLFSLFILALGWSVQTNLEKQRKRILAVFGRHFPRCPICKSDKGYEIHGFLPSSQYVRCKNCEAEWTSPDFIGFRDLKTLKLWNPPETPQVYAEFISSQSPLKLRKSYPTSIWQAFMKGEKTELPAKIKGLGRIQLEEAISSHKRGFILCLISSVLVVGAPFLFTLNYGSGCFAISSGISLASTIIGFYGFTVSKENAYILFWTVFIPMFIGLITLPRII